MDSFVSCLYEKEWYDDTNEEVSAEENDVLVLLILQYIFIGLQLMLNA